MRDLSIPCALVVLAALGGAVRAEDKYDEANRRFQVKEHTNTVYAVTISPDGKTLATAGKDKSIRFFDLATGKRINILRHEAEVWSVGYSGDGKSFAFSDSDKNVIVVDAATLKETARLKDFESPVAMLALSPDGSLLATIEDGLQVPHCWELPSGKARAVFEGHGDKVNSVAFSPDGKHVASTSGDETIRIWDASAAGIPGRPLRGHDGPASLAVFSPDGKTLLSAATRDKTVRLWDLSTFKVKLAMEGHQDEVHFVGYGPGGMMASLSKDGVAKLWDADGKETASFLWTADSASLPSYGTSVALSPDGTTLAVGHDDVVDVWDLTKVKSGK